MEDDHFISPDQIRAAFDSAAKEYDKHAVLQRTVLAHLMERLEFIRLNGDTLLDLGAGTGGGNCYVNASKKRPLSRPIFLTACYCIRPIGVFYQAESIIEFVPTRMGCRSRIICLNWCSPI